MVAAIEPTMVDASLLGRMVAYVREATPRMSGEVLARARRIPPTRPQQRIDHRHLSRRAHGVCGSATRYSPEVLNVKKLAAIGSASKATSIKITH